MKLHKRSNGFSLVELMIVVVIIGIITTIALPSYQKYVVKTHFSEGYSMMDLITKSEVSYFSEHNEFVAAWNNSGLHAKNPGSMDSTSVIVETDSWKTLGNPIPVGAKTKFGYMVVGTKFDENGDEMVAGPTTGNLFLSINQGRVLANGYIDPSVTCHATPNASIGSILGLSGSANYNVAIIAAVGDLNNDYGDMYGNCQGY